MDTSVAFVVCQVSVDDCPLSMVSGLAVNDAVGAAGGGGGGGGGGGCFLWHAPSSITAPSAKTRAILLNVSCFNFFLPNFSAVNMRHYRRRRSIVTLLLLQTYKNSAPSTSINSTSNSNQVPNWPPKW